jgi:hypothetical protein
MKLSICAIFRDESKYLREWVQFHALQGCEKFFLYQNRSVDDWQSVLQPYIDSGLVEVTDWPYPPPCQIEAYNNYIEGHIGMSEWCGFIDIDEFLFSPKYDTVIEALDSFPAHWQSIAVNWMCFGSSGEQEWKDIPVIERFTWRKPADIPSNHYVKPIVRMDKHFTIQDPHCANASTFTPSGRITSGPHSIPHEHDILRINHYGSKSRQEWVKRQLLGKPCVACGPSPEKCFDEIQGWDVDDKEIQRFLPELKRRLECKM